ncbi:hypothetical protein EUTSA_v10009962mg [Eutrema salsugineum]|uniref:Auxin efflux carrier component n=1 Tax=Eutrema salsugineum TaxID=72664 RepID=V4MQ52_EUTSA|nr:hypothetical protein EUTSA_v10009962mg [Eutrema salsugineum]
MVLSLAYGSVKWWKIFTAEQCTGINRFVSVFTVPVLSFHFISQNNPYKMDTMFIIADTLSKLMVLVLLSLWDQVRYTLLLFLFELRAARLLIRTEFPGQAAGSIAKIQVDDDVISLDEMDTLRTETETDVNGRISLRIRRSISSTVPDFVLSSSTLCLTPRASNLSNAEIFSFNTPHRFFHDGGSGTLQFYNGDINEIMFCNGDLSGFGFIRPEYGVSPRRLSGHATSDAYSLHPNELDVNRTEKKISFTDALKAAPPSMSASMEEAAAGKDTALVAAFGKQEMPSAIVMVQLILTVVGRKLSRNPNTYYSMLGLVCRWNIEMPSIVAFSIKIISDASLGMGMFSLGLFMALQPKIIACGAKKATIGMLIRFISGPLFMAAASLLVGLKGSRLHAAILQAALSQGIVPFVFAMEYGLHPDLLSTLVIFGMIVSLPVTILYYVLLGL